MSKKRLPKHSEINELAREHGLTGIGPTPITIDIDNTVPGVTFDGHYVCGVQAKAVQ